jgi:hypothetical protein
MPALDQCHEQVVRALEKEGWRVGKKPHAITVPDRHPLYIDLKARRGRSDIVVVEVKCFADKPSQLNELYTAIGQYAVYRNLLRQKGSPLALYLAIPKSAYEGVFAQIAMPVIAEFAIKMIIIDLDREVVEQWSE